MPAGGRYLLDTNVVIALFEGDLAVVGHLKADPEVFVPVVVIGELLFGAAKSGRALQNANRVERFATANSLVACDLPVAREYGRLKHELRIAGRPIPENDLWVAAIAVQRQLILVTRDRHFGGIPGLSTEVW